MSFGISPNPLSLFRYLLDALCSSQAGQKTDPKLAKLLSDVSEHIHKADVAKALPSITDTPPPIAILIEDVAKSTCAPKSSPPIPNKKRTLAQIRQLIQNNQKEWEKNNKGPVMLNKAISENKMKRNRVLMLELYTLQGEYNALLAEQRHHAEARTKTHREK